MKTMKKILVLVSALFVLFCFAACNNTDNNGGAGTTDLPSTTAGDMNDTTGNDMLPTATDNAGNTATNGNGNGAQ